MVEVATETRIEPKRGSKVLKMRAHWRLTDEHEKAEAEEKEKGWLSIGSLRHKSYCAPVGK